MKRKDLHELAWAQSKDAMRIIDGDGILLDANEAYCKIIGKRRAELVGEPFVSLYADYLRADLLREELLKFSSTSTDKSEIQFVELWDERMLWIENRSTVIRSETEKDVLLSLMTDVTQRTISEFSRANTLEVMRASEERFQAIIESSQDWIWETDRDGMFTFVSKQVESVLGYEPAELIGKSAYEFMTNGDDSGVSQSFTARWSAHQRFRDVQWVHRHKSDRLIFLESNGDPFGDERKDHFGYRGITRNITERVFAEEALRASEKKYRDLVAQSPDGIFIADANGSFLSVNKAMCDGLKYTEDELLRMTIWDVILPEYRELHRGRLTRILQGQDRGLPVEYVAIAKDGQQRWTEVRSSQYLLERGAMGLQGVARDITERKQAEALLCMSEAKLSNALQMANLGHWEHDVASDLFTFNDQFYAMYHTTVEQVGGYTMSPDSYASRFVHPDDISLVRRRVQRGLGSPDTSHSLQLEHRIIYADGGTGYITVRAFVVKDAEGRAIKTYGVNQDITERRRAEEALLQSEERYRTMFETTGTAGLLFDEEGVIRLVNREFEKLSGYSRQEIEGRMKWPEFVSERDRQVMLDRNRRRVDGAKNVPSEYEFGFVTRRGDLRTIFLTANLIPGTKQCVASLMDVTDRRKAAELFVQRSRELEAIVRSLDDIVFEVDKNGTYQNVWTADESMLAKPRSELVGHSIPEIMGDVGHRIVDSIRQVLETGDRDIIEYPMEIQGEIRWFSAVVNRVESRAGYRQTASVLVRDVTDRKNAEIQLRRSEEQYRSLVENERDVIFSLSPDGIIMSTNPAFAKMTEWDSEEWVGRTFTDLFRPEDREMAREAFGAAHDRGSGGSRECHVISRSGKDFLVEVTWAPQFVDGKISRILGIARDITEHRILESQLRRAQKLETIGTLAAGIAHDFNNILTIISGQVSLLEGRHVNLDTLSKRTNAIHNAVQRGSHLARQILTFSRKKTAGVGLVNVNDQMRELSVLLMETFPRSIEITLELDKSEPIVLMDQSQLHQALLNLCINARDAIQDASPSGMGQGRLKLQTAVIPREQLGVNISAASSQYFLCIKVSDTGMGMSEETKKRIFEPFFTTKGEGKGTGLGLTAVFEFISACEGLIDVRSAVGEGTTFTMYFPSDSGTSGSLRTEGSGSEEPRGGSEVILVIEDEKSLLDIMNYILTEKGYTVLAENDGPGAIEAFRRESASIDLVVTDLGLPQTDPIGMIAAMREIKPEVKIVVASGYSLSTVKAELLNNGVKAFIPKPYSPNEVLGTIRMVLDGKGEGFGFGPPSTIR